MSGPFGTIHTQVAVTDTAADHKGGSQRGNATAGKVVVEQVHSLVLNRLPSLLLRLNQHTMLGGGGWGAGKDRMSLDQEANGGRDV